MEGRSTTLFFVIALGLCTIGLLAPTLAAIGVLGGKPEDYMAGAPLAALSPLIAATIASYREDKWKAVRALFRGMLKWRTSILWYAIAILGPTVIFTVARAVYGLVPGNHGGPWFYPPERPEHIAALFVIPLGEEIGWRGYALPRLIQRHGALMATMILGVLWSLWHIPMFLSAGSNAYETAICCAFIFAGCPLFTWVYRRSGASTLLAVLLHFGVHLDGMTHAEEITPVIIAAIAYALFAIGLIMLDRRAFTGKTPAIG